MRIRYLVRANLFSGLTVIAVTLMVSGAGAAERTPNTITFKHACRAGDRVTIVAVGDLLFHNRLNLQVFRKGGTYKQFWRPVSKLIRKADLAYGNLEGPAAAGVSKGGRAVKDPGRRLDYRVYGYRPPLKLFNYHPSVVADLKTSGFDVVSTANNHSMDRGALGVEKTIDVLRRHRLAFTGTRKRGDTKSPWSTVTRAKGLSVAWLACSYSTNGNPDRHNQTLQCFKHRKTVLKEIKRLARDPKIDAVMLTPHWGHENSHRPNSRQRKLARDAIEAGATAVLGAHPHVLQPWEKYVTKAGREGLIVYSMGNFISNQRRGQQRTGLMVVLELLKGKDGKVRLSAAGYVPTWVVIGGVSHKVYENTGALSWSLRHVQSILPPGNRALIANLPRLPRGACGSQFARASWGIDRGETVLTSALAGRGRYSRTVKRRVTKRRATKRRRVIKRHRGKRRLSRLRKRRKTARR